MWVRGRAAQDAAWMGRPPQYVAKLVDEVDPTYSPEPEHELVNKLTIKVNNAYHRWGLPNHVDAAAVEARLRDWAATR